MPPYLSSTVDYERLQFVPIINVPLGAGPEGNMEEMRVEEHVAIPREYLRNEVRIEPGQAFVAKVLGESMRDLLHDGDLVLGERLDEMDRDGLLAFTYSGGLYVKHVQRMPATSRLRIVSENTHYETFEISAGEIEMFHLIGRIVRRLTRL